MAAADSRPAGAYIRGAGVVLVEGRRLRGLMIAIGLVCLAVLILVLTVDAARTATSYRRLAEHGVPVRATVTRCLGLASGTGITPVGYTCRGSFTLAGRRYNDVVEGTTRHYQIGETVAGVSDPADPGRLFTTRSVAAAPAAWQRFIAPAILFVLLWVGCGFAVRLRRP